MTALVYACGWYTVTMETLLGSWGQYSQVQVGDRLVRWCPRDRRYYVANGGEL